MHAPSAAPAAHYPFLDSPPPLAFAHRGGACEADENTLPAFAHAVGLGYRYVETDVQASRDGVVVIFHDDTLWRLTGAPGRVRDYDWAELSRLTTRSGEPLPRLDQVFATWPELRLNIEPKSDHAVEPLAETIRRCEALDRVCVGSFEVRRTLRLRVLLGERLCWSPSYGAVTRMWLTGWGLPRFTPAYPALQVPPRHHGIPVATRRFVRAAHACGVHVHVWTIDSEREMEHLLDIGVDGLMTDRPTLLKQVLQRRGQWTGG